jgi:hypothetical protein
VAEEVDEDDILAALDRDEVAFGDAIWDNRDEDFIPSPDNDEGVSEGLEANGNISLPSNNIASSGGDDRIAISTQLHNVSAPVQQIPAQQMSDDRCKVCFGLAVF